MRLHGESLWALSLYPEAGEGGGCLWVRRRLVPSEGRPDAVRAAEEAGRRARAKIRRYAAANRLNRLGTLTYRGQGCHDPLRLRGDLAGFFRELRAGLGGEPVSVCVGAAVASGRATVCTRTSPSAALCRGG